MRPCANCRNPCAEFYRTQCMYEGEGERPCEREARKKRDKRDKQFISVVIVLVAAILLAAVSFLTMKF